MKRGSDLALADVGELSGDVGFHNCSGHLVLEKNQHPLVSRTSSIHLCDQVIYARSADLVLAGFSMCDELKVQSCLGTDYLLN